MILRLAFIVVLIGAFVEAGPSAVFAASVTVTVHKQVMAPTMELDPERATVQVGDTVTWVNLTGRAIKFNPDWQEAADLPPFIRPGGTVHFQFDRAGTYPYAVYTVSDRFEEDRVPVKVSGVVLVTPPASGP